MAAILSRGKLVKSEVKKMESSREDGQRDCKLKQKLRKNEKWKVKIFLLQSY